ncbi:hypothetical protein OSB04_017693 [Centaurea solstitialis]|uniref:GAG-pre-integrase domain-containing protein n=1 Tax=Centaurea solstitialis TaxID=347529 RepID=A0AA38T3D0_9ASTR|nr:hypothetical protein OSB04_017693 [Centaurea solstitialis]
MRYFSHLTTQKANISTISGVVNIIEGFGKAHVLLSGGTNLKIENALYSPKSQGNLLNFKDIRKNGYHIETIDEGESEYLLITNISSGKKNVLEKLSMYSSGLYYTKISAIQTNMVINPKFMDRENFILWHDRLGHPGWNELSYLDPQTKQCELKVQKIIQLQRLANQLPDTFTDLKKVTKSHIPAANASIKINVPEGQNNKSRARQKRGRPLGSKDKNPRKKKGANNQDSHIKVNETQEKSPKETLDMMVPEEPQDQEPKSVDECMHRKDWPKWKDAMQTELNSLTKREVFGTVVRTPEGTPGELPKVMKYLKRGFEMKDLGKTKFCLGLQIEHLKDGILVHQEGGDIISHIEKVLKRFYMDKSHPLSTPMVVRSLDVEKEPFRPPTADEDILGPEVPYLSVIGALMFLAAHTRPDISFSLNLLARYNAGYLSDPHTSRSQTGYVFTMGGTAISWHSTKQIMTATSSNHAEILAIHETSRECVWLRNVIHHIRGSCNIISDKEPPTILYEDNAACIAQLKEGYIKGDRTKHILPKFFFTHDL